MTQFNRKRVFQSYYYCRFSDFLPLRFFWKTEMARAKIPPFYDENKTSSDNTNTQLSGFTTELAKLNANDGKAFDLFAASVSISNDTVIVGAPEKGSDPDFPTRSGKHFYS